MSERDPEALIRVTVEQRAGEKCRIKLPWEVDTNAYASKTMWAPNESVMILQKDTDTPSTMETYGMRKLEKVEQLMGDLESAAWATGYSTGQKSYRGDADRVSARKRLRDFIRELLAPCEQPEVNGSDYLMPAWTTEYPTKNGVYWMKQPTEKPILVIVDGYTNPISGVSYYHYNASLHKHGLNAVAGFPSVSWYNPIINVEAMNQPGILFSDRPVMPPVGGGK